VRNIRGRLSKDGLIKPIKDGEKWRVQRTNAPR
jgi:hypothetical protein